MKVRVPKELRPPALEFESDVFGMVAHPGRYRCVAFRMPRTGEFYFPKKWEHDDDAVFRAGSDTECQGPRVILERIQP